ncbi:hypothetical protein Hanom_Chr05g00412601 [Helianthus anomalus]
MRDYVGVCLPSYTVQSVSKTRNLMDTTVVTICLTSIVIAYIADTQLHTFVSRNERRKQFGQPLVPNLDIGLWYYSRALIILLSSYGGGVRLYLLGTLCVAESLLVH